MRSSRRSSPTSPVAATCRSRCAAWLRSRQASARCCCSLNLEQPAGGVLFRAGDRSDGLYRVDAGVVGLVKASEGGGESVITRLVHAGDLLGQRTFFAGGAYCSKAVAVVDVELSWFPRDVVEAALQDDPALARELLKHLARDLRSVEEERLAACSPLRARLARLIADLADRYGRDTPEGLRLDLPLSRQEIAGVLAVRPESVARAVGELKRLGIARFKGRAVLIPDLEALLDERC